MKSIKCIVAISLVLFFTKAFACIPLSYEPSEYYLFHLMDKQEWVQETYNINERENCRLWQEQTLSIFTPEEIKAVVYHYKLETLRQLKEGRNPQESLGNNFAQWLRETKNDEVLDYLILAKTCEWLRLEHQSPWYYPCKSDPVRCSLSDVVETALSHNDDAMAERYALQAVRAMITLRQYEKCVDYWEKTVCHFPDGLMRQMIEPYVAGAYYHSGRIDEAKRMFALLGDVDGLLLCENKIGKSLSLVEGIELLYETLPDCPHFKQKNQWLLGNVEPNLDWDEFSGYCFNVEKAKSITQLEELCDRVLKEGRVSDPAMWAYSACYIALIKGDDHKADKYLRIAEKNVKDEALEASVKVMRIYIDAKLCDYNKAYEQKLFGQLVWLQRQVESNVTNDVRKSAGELYGLNLNISFYYWNDALRCILLGTVCPKMLEKGNTNLALRLANMADYTLLNCTGLVYDDHWDERRSEYVVDSLTLEQYREDSQFNWYDYRNNFAGMMDTLSANQLAAYVKSVERPQSAFERFLDAHSYTDLNFLNEILGTHYIREMRYAEAQRTLAKLSYNFYRRTNVYKEGLLDFDPFSHQRTSWSGVLDAKYQFACQMSQYEEEITQDSDPNRKAVAMLKMATGLYNSSLRGRSFALGFYQSGYVFSTLNGSEGKNWEQTEMLCRRANELCQQALRLFTDDEQAAEAQYELGNLYTVTSWYPKTKTAQYVKAHCDCYWDYHIERDLYMLDLSTE